MPGTLPDLGPAAPEIFLACAGMLLLMLGVFRAKESTRLVSYLGVLCFIIAGLMSLSLITFSGIKIG